MADPQPDYAAPAVDKALDILEILADTPAGLSQLDIAKAISRSPGQIFRMLSRLDKRGYIHRDPQTGLYGLSMRLFDLAHRHEPVRVLISSAVPLMRTLSEEVRQSCNLSVLEGERVRILAQVESPADFGFHVRVGAGFSASDTATGRVLLAFSPGSPTEIPADVLAGIRMQRALIQPDAVQPGITDIVHPLLRTGGGDAVAALTIPYVATSFSGMRAEDVSAAAARTARQIERALGI